VPATLNGIGEEPPTNGRFEKVKKIKVKKMSPSNEILLIDYIDNNLETEDRLHAEQLIREDGQAANELKAFQFAVELIREAGLQAQVAAARKEFQAGAKLIPIGKKDGGTVVRSMYKNVFRVAAMVVLFLGAAAIYEYAATNASGVFDKNYTSFDLNTSRGNNTDGDIEKAYRNKDWAAVKNIFNGQKEKSTKAWFLSGMADMELKNYTTAIASFKEVMNQNKGRADEYFQEEAEYYLAMSYLAAGQPVEGVAILQKIRADKNHLFNKKAAEMSSMDLKVLELKGDK
jgi:tetratricopeptide (TPR) repeat protein